MPWDFQFDPVSRDLVRAGGTFAKTYTAETLVMHQVLCTYGECWQDENLGSRLADLQYLQPNPEQLAQLEAERCLGVLEARGRIDNIEVETQMDGPARVDVQTQFRDTSTGQVVTTSAVTGG